MARFLWRFWLAPAAAIIAVILYFIFDLRLPPQAGFVSPDHTVLAGRLDAATAARRRAIRGGRDRRLVVTGFWQPGLR